MTREEILAMKPGKELDALVAEKVIELNGEHDWIKDKDGEIDIFAYESGNCNGPKCNVCGYEYCHHCHKEPPIKKCSEVKAYSSDISAAWEVVEKMAKEWPDFSVTNDENGVWASMWGFDGHGWDWVEAKTAPEAICKAALLAVMEEEK